MTACIILGQFSMLPGLGSRTWGQFPG